MALPTPQSIDPVIPNKLVLCFDGTGNTFSGSNADTNVVKILNKLDRQHPQQYHYYQRMYLYQSIHAVLNLSSWCWNLRYQRDVCS